MILQNRKYHHWWGMWIGKKPIQYAFMIGLFGLPLAGIYSILEIPADFRKGIMPGIQQMDDENSKRFEKLENDIGRLNQWYVKEHPVLKSKKRSH